MDNGATSGAIHLVHDSCEEGLDLVAGNDQCPGPDALRFIGGVEECPDIAALIHLVDITGQGDQNGFCLAHRCPLR